MEKAKFDRERTDRIQQWRSVAEQLEREEKQRFDAELIEWKNKLELQKNQEINEMIKVPTNLST